MLLALAAVPAFACPTVATGTPSALSFDTAQVAIVREGRRTTFSVSINPAGDPQDFALVMPVPEVLSQDEVRTLDAAIFATLDGYSAPRHVADAGCVPASTDQADGGSGGGGLEQGGEVDVEAEYLVGDYQVVILSAEESLGLEAWLNSNGYHLPDGADERLAEYIESGSFFLAAKVAPGADLADGSPLAPLQVAYDSEGFSIPMRLATLNSPGEQDMIIYAITAADAADGARVGIANYPEFTVPDMCIWGDAAGDFTAFYEDLFTDAWTAVGDAGWTVEYAGIPGDCSPCTSVAPTADDLAALGFVGDATRHHLTRIHMRYTPEQANQDLALYGSGLYEPLVTSYADDNEYNRECVEPGCFAEDEPAPGGGEDDPASEDPEAEPALCATPGGAGALGVAVAVLVAARRRRAR